MKVNILTAIYLTKNGIKQAGPFESEKEAILYAEQIGWEIDVV